MLAKIEACPFSCQNLLIVIVLVDFSEDFASVNSLTFVHVNSLYFISTIVYSRAAPKGCRGSGFMDAEFDAPLPSLIIVMVIMVIINLYPNGKVLVFGCSSDIFAVRCIFH